MPRPKNARLFPGRIVRSGQNLVKTLSAFACCTSVSIAGDGGTVELVGL